MIDFKNAPADPRTLVGTNYWDSTEAQTGQLVISYQRPLTLALLPTFRLLIPMKSQQKAGQVDFTPLLQALEDPSTEWNIDSDRHFLHLSHLRFPMTHIPWSNVHGITNAEFPEDCPPPCQLAVYTYRKAPHLSHTRRARYGQLPF